MSAITIEMTPQEFQRIIATTVEDAIDRKFDRLVTHNKHSTNML